MSAASDQITQYLSIGGLFNPEMMNQYQHEAVRDTLIKARDDIQRLECENAALRAALEEVLPSLKGDMAVSIAFGDPRNMHEYTRLYQRVCEVLGKTP